jgi:hypothetical protein
MSYLRRRIRRAFADTCALLGLNSVAQVLIRSFVALLIVGLVWWFEGSDAAVGRSKMTLITGGAILAVFPTVFLFQMLFLVPAKIDRENQAEIERLRAQVARRERHRDALDGVAASLVQGNQLFNMNIKNGDFPSWRNSVDEWVNKTVIALSANFGQSDAQLFIDPGRVIDGTFSSSVNAEHNQYRLFLRARLDSLREIMRRHSPDINLPGYREDGEGALAS